MKKGFTLIELLAVIVVLAIIALIATPMILNVVEKARKGAAKSSALGYIDAVEKQIMINLLDSDTTNDITDGSYELPLDDKYALNVKGSIPISGSMTINKSKVTEAIMCINGYSIKYENNSTKILKKCSGATDKYPSIIYRNDSVGTITGSYVDHAIELNNRWCAKNSTNNSCEYGYSFGTEQECNILLMVTGSSSLSCSQENTITTLSIEDYTTDRTTLFSKSYNYIKHTLNPSTGQIESTEVCWYNQDKKELCIGPNDYENSVATIKEYLEVDESTGYSAYKTNVRCSSGSTGGIGYYNCYTTNFENFQIFVTTTGDAAIWLDTNDTNDAFNCGIGNSGVAGCGWHNLEKE